MVKDYLNFYIYIGGLFVYCNKLSSLFLKFNNSVGKGKSVYFNYVLNYVRKLV